MDNSQSFLGRGWSFPPTFDRESKTVAMVIDEEDIRQSLRILLSTRLGERIMQPDFGCNLDDLVFSAVDADFANRLMDIISNAILENEPRIDLDEIDPKQDSNNPGLILITIKYTISGTNTSGNLVYPFYLEETTA